MRKMGIRDHASVLVALVALLTLLVCLGCGSNSQNGGHHCTVQEAHLFCGPAAGGDGAKQTAEIYAEVVRRLVTKDDTFGGNAGFKRVFLLDAIVPRAGGTDLQLSHATPLSSEVKAAMVTMLKDLPPLKFVSNPSAVIKGAEPDGSPGEVFHGGVLLTLGPISGTPKRVQVPNRLWLSGLASQWQVYVLQKTDGQWKINGNTGVVGIS